MSQSGDRDQANVVYSALRHDGPYDLKKMAEGCGLHKKEVGWHFLGKTFAQQWTAIDLYICYKITV